MSIKSILVVVSGAEETNPALALAFTLAQNYSAHIAALYVKPVVMVYSDGMGFDMTPSVIEAQQAYLQAAADKAESATKAQAAKAGQEIEWPMALVILGGLASSTLLNLVVLPTLALRFGQFQKRSPDE